MTYVSIKILIDIDISYGNTFLTIFNARIAFFINFKIS